MKKIAVVTDSHSSISPAEAGMLGVYVLPMPFDVDGQDYIALAPTDDTETVLIYGYRPAGEEQFELFEIEEEDTYIKVVAEFNQIISEE